MAIQKATMLACDLLIIAGLFGMAGYYYGLNQMSAGDWYIIQYDVDMFATAVQTASTGCGVVNMTMTLPAHSYISLYNDGDTDTEFSMVTGQMLHRQRSMEWIVLNTLTEGLKEYNQIGFIKGPIVNGLGTVIKYIVSESSVVSYSQITAPSIETCISNTMGDYPKTFNVEFDGANYVTSGGVSVPVVTILHSEAV